MMLSKVLSSLLLLFSFHLYSQEVFFKDSIEVEEQTNYLLKKTEVINDESALLDSLGRNLSDFKSDTIIDFLMYQGAKYFYMKGMFPKALLLVNKALQDDYLNESKDAKFFNLKGIIFSLEKKYDSAIANYLSAVSGYQSGGYLIKEHVVYNNIANIYLALGDFKQSYYYTSKCFQEIGKHPQDKNYLTMLGILIICENNLKKLDKAENHLNELIPRVDTSRNILAKVIAYYAQSEYYYKIGDYAEAIKPVERSILLSENLG